MEDKYLYFTFNNISSSTFNCFYINNGEDLSFPVFPQFGDNKSAPLFQQHSYYLGTSIEDKTFSLNCACDSITIKQFRQLQKWLNIETIGDLKFDWLANFHYKVKVSSFSNIMILPQYTNVYLTENLPFSCTFTVNFTTIEDYAAISDIQYEFDTMAGYSAINPNYNDTGLINGEELVDETYKLPLIDYDPDCAKMAPEGRRIRLFNVESYPYYINISSDEATIYKLIASSEKIGNNVEWYSYNNLTIPLKLKTESKLGYVSGTATIDGVEKTQLIERFFQDNAALQESFINNGPFEVPSSILYQLSAELISVSQRPVDKETGELYTYATFEIPYSEISNFKNGKWFSNNVLTENGNENVICLQTNNITDYSLYNRNGYSEGLYYVNDLNTKVSYRYGIDGSNKLVIAIFDPAVENGHTFYDQCYAALYGHYPGEEASVIESKKFLISLMKYLEIDIRTQNSAILKNNHITFHLRTVF